MVTVVEWVPFLARELAYALGTAKEGRRFGEPVQPFCGNMYISVGFIERVKLVLQSETIVFAPTPENILPGNEF